MLRDIGFVCPIRIHQPISRLKNGGRRSGETHQRATPSPPPQTPLFRLLFPFGFVRTKTQSPQNQLPPRPETCYSRNKCRPILPAAADSSKPSRWRAAAPPKPRPKPPPPPRPPQPPPQPPPAPTPPATPHPPQPVALPRSSMRYPRIYTGRQLAMLAMPLGGIAAGSISLGGRGQLRDWELFNRPDKGRSPEYAFASIWAQAGSRKPVAHVLEARLMPPYAGPDGPAARHAPGLSPLEGAPFTGEFPIAQIAFRDSRLPVNVTLDAFSPFIPLDAEESGLPIAILRYRVHNPGKDAATVSIAWSIENPIGVGSHDPVKLRPGEQRINEYRESGNLKGLMMSNPGIPGNDPEAGTLAVCLVKPEGKLSYLRGWINAKWWTSPLLFWDDFSQDGQLGPEAPERKPIGSLCLQQEIAPGTEAAYTFLLAWHFPNRTPAWSGWTAPKGDEHTIIGNHYCTRFPGAWQAAEYAAEKLPDLEARTRRFVGAMRDSTLPPAVRDAAMSTLSTLVTQTCFRTADGEFHGFDGSDDHNGCCFGNCTHVWNYETATQHLFPA